MREGQPKAEDRGTGSLAVMLNKLARSPVIYTRHQSPSDPNYYDDNELKRTLSEMLKQYSPAVVLDLHTSHFNRPYDVDFGTMGGASLIGSPHFLQLLARSLRNEGLSNFSQDYFAAARQRTITKWVSRQGVPCIQLEINATWMVPTGAAEQNALQRQRFAQLLQGLTRFVRAVGQGRTGQPGGSGPNGGRCEHEIGERRERNGFRSFHTPHGLVGALGETIGLDGPLFRIHNPVIRHAMARVELELHAPVDLDR
jgi:hypothetical protein